MNTEKEREVLAQLYSNTADVSKYLPFFFNNIYELKSFFDIFGGKTIKLPETFDEYIKNYLIYNKYVKNNQRGIKNINKIKPKILESYINLFKSLEDVIKTECSKKE